MTEQTKEEQEFALKMVSFSMKSAIVIFIVLAVVFYFEIIPVANNKLIAFAFLGLAFMDVFILKFMTARMRRKIDQS